MNEEIEKVGAKNLISRTYYFKKRILPTMWFGFLAFVVVLLLTQEVEEGSELIAFAMPVFMAIGGYIGMKNSIFNIIDEVYDEGDFLLFRNSRKEARISLRDIKKISVKKIGGHRTVTINIGHESELGNKLTFVPRNSSSIFSKSTEVEELMERINKAR